MRSNYLCLYRCKMHIFLTACLVDPTANSAFLLSFCRPVRYNSRKAAITTRLEPFFPPPLRGSRKRGVIPFRLRLHGIKSTISGSKDGDDDDITTAQVCFHRGQIRIIQQGGPEAVCLTAGHQQDGMRPGRGTRYHDFCPFRGGDYADGGGAAAAGYERPAAAGRGPHFAVFPAGCDPDP